MSHKFYKKIRRTARKEIDKHFEQDLSVISTMIQPRPFYVPKFIWILGYMVVFKKRFWKLIYKKLN